MAPSGPAAAETQHHKRSSHRDAASTDCEDNQKITDMLHHIDKSILELNRINPDGRQVLQRLNFNPNAKYSKRQLNNA